MSDSRRNTLNEKLAVFGSDFSKWPRGLSVRGREAVLADPEFRRAWESERAIDRRLAQHRSELDGAIAESGAVERVSRRVLAQAPSPWIGVGWQKVAAAVLLAGMLGGAVDLFLAEQAPEAADIVLLDPLYGLAEAELE